METPLEYPLPIGTEVVIRGAIDKQYRPIIYVSDDKEPFYVVKGSSELYTEDDFTKIRRGTHTLSESLDLFNVSEQTNINNLKQQKEYVSPLKPKMTYKENSYTLQDLPMYKSMLVPNFGYVLRLPEGYVFSSQVTFIPNQIKEML